MRTDGRRNRTGQSGRVGSFLHMTHDHLDVGHYRCSHLCVPPSKAPANWVEIVSADDDVVSCELLKWSGLSERWERHNLGDLYDFLSDVAEHCEHISIDRKDWDAGAPGRSGVWHSVTSNNQRALKAEMTARLSLILRTDQDKIKLYAQSLKAECLQESKGPNSARLLCEADVWDDLSPTSYSAYVEEPSSASQRYRLWERTNKAWRLTSISAPKSAGIKHAVRAMLHEYLGPPNSADIVSFRSGPIFDEEGLESVAREYQTGR